MSRLMKKILPSIAVYPEIILPHLARGALRAGEVILQGHRSSGLVTFSRIWDLGVVNCFPLRATFSPRHPHCGSPACKALLPPAEPCQRCRVPWPQQASTDAGQHASLGPSDLLYVEVELPGQTRQAEPSQLPQRYPWLFLAVPQIPKEGKRGCSDT